MAHFNIILINFYSFKLRKANIKKAGQKCPASKI